MMLDEREEKRELRKNREEGRGRVTRRRTVKVIGMKD